MKPLATLRLLSLLVLFALAANSASAVDGAKKCRKAACKAAKEQTVTPRRKMVAAFVDPTSPLAELVERERTARNKRN